MVGDNGCGKSSLFALILGELGADQGDIAIPEDTVIAHVAQQTPSSDQLAIDYVLDGDQVLRNTEKALRQIDHHTEGEKAAELYGVMEHIDGYSAPARAARLMHGLGFSSAQLNAITRSFSGGWRVRLNLARALMCPSDLLLLDEPTNHLDLDAVVWLEDWLSGYQGTLLMISHDRDFIDATCQRILHIEHCGIKSYSGNYSSFEQTRAEVLATEQAAYQKQQRVIAHMQSYVSRFKAKATKARQAQSRVKALERMQLIAPAHVHSPFNFDFLEPARVADPVLKLDEVSAGYGQNLVLEDVSLSIGNTDRIALVGPNGAGKSTLIKLLAGTVPAATGSITQAKGLNIGYFAQHQLEQLDPAVSPLQQLQKEFPHRRHQELRNYLGGFGFRGDRVEEKIGPLSGGEKARLALALLIFRQPNLLLMDEPTNHLDIEMRHALTVAFQSYQGAIVLVSHDRHLIRTVSDQLWLVSEGQVKQFDEDIEGYMRWSKKASANANAMASKPEQGQVTSSGQSSSRKILRQQSAKLREKMRPLTRELRTIESEIEKKRNAALALERTLADPDTYENESTANLAQMMQKKSRLESAIDQHEEKWLSLSEELESLNKILKQG